MRSNQPGVWVPDAVFKALWTLRLESSDWNVLLVVLYLQHRYGGREAKITLKRIGEEAGLSRSTVKRAVRRLITSGHLQRRKRGILHLTLGENTPTPLPAPGRPAHKGVNMVTPSVPETAEHEGSNIVTPSRVQHADPFPTTISLLDKTSSSSAEDLGAGPFSRKQAGVVADVLRKVSGSLGRDALDLTVVTLGDGEPHQATGKTFREWFSEVTATGNKAEAGRFVRAVLALRTDPRVVGMELDWRR